MPSPRCAIASKLLQGFSQRAARYSGKVPLRAILVVPFVAQIVGAVSLVGYLSLRNEQAAVQNLASQLMEEVGDRISLHLTNFLAAPHLLNQLNANALQASYLNLQDSNNLRHHLWTQLQIFDSVTSNAYGRKDGTYISVIHTLNDQFLVGELQPSSSLQIYGLDPAGNPTRLLQTVPNSDFRQTGWYEQTRQRREATWSPIDLWPTAEFRMGLWATLPVYDQQGQLQGVLNSGLGLDQISHFLNTLTIGQTGASFIIEPSGLLVASSTSESPFIAGDGSQTTQRLSAVKSQQPMISISMDYLLTHFSQTAYITAPQQLNLTIDGQQHFLRVVPFQDAYGLDWLVVIVVPESDFLAQIDANTHKTIVLCGVALLVAIAISTLTTRWITAPILRLNQAAKRLAQGQFDPPLTTHRQDELGELTHAFNHMAQQLELSFAELQVLNHVLAKNETRLKQFLDALPIAVAVHETNASVLYFNQKASQLLGITTIPQSAPDNLIDPYLLYRAGTDIPYPDEDLPAIQGLKGKQIVLSDIEIAQGERRIPVEVYTQPILDEAGTVQYAIVIFQDITQRKQAELLQADYSRTLETQVAAQTEALRRSEATNRAILEAIPDLLLRIRGDGTYLDRLSGGEVKPISSGQSVIGLNIYDALPQDMADLRRYHIGQALTTGNLQIYEQQLQVGDELRFEETRIVKTGADEVLVIVRDISSRKQAENALRRSEAQNKAILAAIPDLMFRINAAGIYLGYVRNNYAIDMLPHTFDPIGRHISEYLPPEQAARNMQHMQQALATGQPQIYQQESWVNGKLQHEEVRVVVSGPDELLFMVRDISQQQAALKQRERTEATLREREQQLQLFFTQALDGFMFMELDCPICWDGTGDRGQILDYVMHHMRVTRVNNALADQYGATREQILGMTQADFFAHDLDQGRLLLQRFLDQRKLLKVTEERRMDGSVAYFEEQAVGLYNDADELLGCFIAQRDITERKQTEATLQAQQQFLQQVIDAIPSALFVKDKDGYFVLVNKVCAVIYGTTPEQLIGRRDQDFNSDRQQIDEFLTNNDQTMLTGETQVFLDEPIYHPEHGLRWYQTIISSFVGINGEVQGIIGNCIDVSDRKASELALKQLNLELERLATLDSLTQLANRRRFDDYLGQEWQRLAREERPLSLILLDIDCFKAYNDHYGHPQGDDCLIQVAQTIAQAVQRSADLVARYGGEEFAIILPNTDKEGAIAITETIRAAIHAVAIPHPVSQVSDVITVSLGIATVVPWPDQAFSTLVSQADQALYEAKQQGRNRYVLAQPMGRRTT